MALAAHPIIATRLLSTLKFVFQRAEWNNEPLKLEIPSILGYVGILNWPTAETNRSATTVVFTSEVTVSMVVQAAPTGRVRRKSRENFTQGTRSDRVESREHEEHVGVAISPWFRTVNSQLWLSWSNRADNTSALQTT